jgi:tetratricopeptide (TPR) repeat protein
MELGDLRAVESELNAIQSIGRQYRIRNNDKWVAIHRAAQCMLRGAYDLAEQHAREGLLAGQDVEDPDAPSIFGAQLFQVRWDQGRLSELESLVTQMGENTGGFPAWSAAVGVLHAELGQRAQAERVFKLLTADPDSIPRDRFWIVTMLLLSQVCAFLNDLDRAGKLYDQLRPFGERMGVVSLGEVCTGSNERTLGLLCTVMRRYDDAEAHFGRAIVANERIGALPFLARTRVNYARMLLERGQVGDSDRAQKLLEPALSTATELGMAGLADEARSLAGTASTAAR